MDKSSVIKEPVDESEAMQASSQFVINEIRYLSERWSHTDQIAENRSNTYVTVASGATGILVLLSQLQTSTEAMFKASLVLFILVWLLGLVTFFRLVERGIVVVEYIRAINRARRFFVDKDPQLTRYLAFSASDSHPLFVRLGARKFSARTFTAIICSLSFGLFWGVCISIIDGAQITESAIIVGGVAFLLHLAVAETYVTLKLQKREKSYKIVFPDA
jgi:hypothetical protein